MSTLPPMTEQQAFYLDESGIGEVGTKWGTRIAIAEAQASILANEVSNLENKMGVATVVCPLTPNATSTAYLAASSAKTTAKLEARADVVPSSAAGTITLAVQNAAGTTLLSTATVDAEALTTSYANLTLTATTSDLGLDDGEALKVVLVSNNADAVGGPVIVRVTYA